jgi:hypothetical protein
MEGITAQTSAAAPPATVLGQRVVQARRSGGGYTRGWRGVVTLADGGSAFVKTAAGENARSLRREGKVLRWLEESNQGEIGPRLLEFKDGDGAMLVIEDLSESHWPPPWPVDTMPLFDALAALARVDAPADLDKLEDWDDGSASRWARVAADPARFLALETCSSAWLDENLQSLMDAEQRIDQRGTKLVHNDVYSGNVCFRDGRAVLTDWATAARGNPDLDVAFAIVSVLAEGGRLPERPLLADEGAWAARLAGHNAVEASSPLPPWAEPNSTLREDQLNDLRAALPWAARALGLAEPLRA